MLKIGEELDERIESLRKNPGTITLKFNKPIEPGLSKEEFMDMFKMKNSINISSNV